MTHSFYLLKRILIHLGSLTLTISSPLKMIIPGQRSSIFSIISSQFCFHFWNICRDIVRKYWTIFDKGLCFLSFFFSRLVSKTPWIDDSKDIMNLLSVVFWTIVSWYNCASMLGRALSCLNMTMALIKWIKRSQSGWHSKPAKGWKDRWVASNSFMRGKKKKKISGRVLEKNGLLVYCTSTYNNTSYSSHFYWKKT